MAFKLMNLRRDDHCAVCTTPTPATTKAWWDAARREVTCTRCRPADFEPVAAQVVQLAQPVQLAQAQQLAPPQPVQVGVAGASARGAFERRAANHLHRNGPTDSDALPQHIVSWQQGADGEQRLGQFLDDAFAGTAVVLHDRYVVNGSKRGNIDHLVIASSGVWVIDAKNHTGTVDVQTQGVWKFKQSDLRVGRRKQNGLVDGMGWQAAAVQSLLEPMGMGVVPVHPALCFVQSEWSRRSNAAVIDGVLVLSPDKLASVVGQPGWVEPDAINAIAHQLSSGLPASR